MAFWLDRVLYRHPFEGASARRYATEERPAFGDLDDRLLDAIAPRLAARATSSTGLAGPTLADVGCGPGTFARRAAARLPHVQVIAIDPSRDFARETDRAGHGVPAGANRVHVLRAEAEALPLADRSVDLAICLSSIRHVRDRAAALRELRRVAAALVIVELDPLADPRRIAAHGDRLGSWMLRRAFGPLVVRTAPRASEIIALAEGAGWCVASLRDDPVQPVYIVELA